MHTVLIEAAARGRAHQEQRECDKGDKKSALGVQEHVLADGQPEDVLRGLQRKAEPPHVVAEDLQPWGVHLLGLALTTRNETTRVCLRTAAGDHNWVCVALYQCSAGPGDGKRPTDCTP